MQTKLLSFELDSILIQSNQIELADTIRFLLYQKHPNLFEHLSYSNDTIFLEPALFYYFSDRSFRTLYIEQLLFSYLLDVKQLGQPTVLSDPFGVLYLAPESILFTEYLSDTVQINELINNNLRGNCIHMSKTIRLNQHVPFILYADKNLNVNFIETVSYVINKYKLHLIKAINLLCEYVPKYWDLIQLVTREISLFNSGNCRSMATMSYHGTIFINVEGQNHDEVFFIEDIAHQCGHVIFYALTLHTEEFLKIDKETPMNSLTGVAQDTRSVYGAFHGLFTYTTILHCLTKCIELGAFTPSQSLEALARIGFFMQKFEMDLKYMYIPRIFTPQGQYIYDCARASFELVVSNYETDYKHYRYDNQPYIFNYELFQQANFPSNKKFDISLNH